MHMSTVAPGPTATASSSRAEPKVLLTSAGLSWRGLDADFVHIPRGMSHVPGSNVHRLGIHFGAPVNADCYCDGLRMRRVQRTGDIDILPAGVDGTWKDDADCHTLQLSLHPSLLLEVADELGHATATDLKPRFQVRDPRIEAIGWAVKAALESPAESDTLYVDSLARALAVRLVETTNGRSGSSPVKRRNESTLSTRQLRVLTEYIESNLNQKLRLADLARVSGIGVTGLKTMFRNSTGLPVHQYVIRRRVEYARALLATTAMPPAAIATAAGFSSQSHMTSTMRRMLGQTPGEIARQTRNVRPNLQRSDRI